MTRSAKMPVKRVDDRTLKCGDWLLHLAESEDPLPRHAAAVILEVVSRIGEPALWMEVFTPKADRYALAAPVGWAVASDSQAWIVGDVFEMALGPLGFGFTMRPRVAAAINTVARTLSDTVGSLTADTAPRVLAQIEREARQKAPREFAVLAGAMRALESEVDDVEGEPDTPGRH